ncbi:MAG: hypothetical protein M3Q73_01000 [bacterium]|nr:hypothetical protein [bacterium]
MSETEKDNNFKKDNPLSAVKYNPHVFKYDYNLYILYRRLENISSAIFLITHDLADTEPLKMSLRKKSLEAISQAVSFIADIKTEMYQLRNAISSILELSSFISIAQSSGAISEMNGTLLQKEMRKIEDTASSVIGSSTKKLIIDPTLFADVDLQARQFEHIQQITEKRAPAPLPHSIKSTINSINVPGVSAARKIQTPKLQQEQGVAKKSERRDLILKLLAQRGNLNVKDFTTVISDYSEKTIQRELLALVDEGVVKKQGERRWSTYSLAQ